MLHDQLRRFEAARRHLHQQYDGGTDGDDGLDLSEAIELAAVRAVAAQVVEAEGHLFASAATHEVELKPVIAIARSGAWISIEPRCSCIASRSDGDATCAHTLALADHVQRLLDTHSPQVSLVRNLLQGVNMTSFMDGEPLDGADRLAHDDREAASIFAQVASAGATAEPTAAEERRVLWRVRFAYQQMMVELCSQRLGKRGAWLKPGAIDTYHLDEHLHLLTSEDLALLRVCQPSFYSSSPAHIRRVAHWRILASRPLVVGDDQAPLEIEEFALVAMVVKDGDGWRVRFPAVEDRPWKAVQELDDGLVALDSAGHSLAIIPADADSLRLWQRRHRLHFGAHTAQSETFRTVIARANVVLPAELEGETVEADTATQVLLSWEGELLGVRLACRPLPELGWQMPGDGQERLHARRAEAGAERWVVAVRRFDGECARAGELRTRLKLPGTQWQWALPLDAGADLIAQLAESGPAPHWQGRPTRTQEADKSHLTVQVRRERDWLGIAAGLRIDDTTIALADLLAASRSDGRWLRLDQDRLLHLSEDLKRRLRQLAAAGERASDCAAPLIDDAIDGLEDDQIDVDQDWLALQRRLRDARNLEPILPKGLTATLRPYQLEGFTWMARLAAWGPGAVLADDMGLGKTVQAISLLLYRQHLGPALVVCPTSVEGNWIDELARFAPTLKVRLFREDRDLERLAAGQVVLASYGLVLRQSAAFAAVRFATLVMDEAQQVKNADAKRTQALAEVPSDWRLALSGTPLENRLDELWSLMRLIVPGLLGSRQGFASYFASAIEVEHDAGRRDELRRRIAPFVLRRTKAAVIPELPERTEIVHRVTLGDHERDLYEGERLRAAEELEDAGFEKRFAILAALTRLRQLACAPGLLLDGHGARSSKLDALVELVEEMKEGGHRALIFSQFTSLLNLAGRRLHDAGFSFLRLDGSTPASRRRELVDSFQGGTGDCFLISLKAGGTGLNLTAADYVIHLDPWWNPAAEDQATDRTHRIGQTRPVTVYRLIATGTVEESILELHREKRDLIDALLADGDRAGSLSCDQLLQLLRQVGSTQV